MGAIGTKRVQTILISSAPRLAPNEDSKYSLAERPVVHVRGRASSTEPVISYMHESTRETEKGEDGYENIDGERICQLKVPSMRQLCNKKGDIMGCVCPRRDRDDAQCPLKLTRPIIWCAKIGSCRSPLGVYARPIVARASHDNPAGYE